MSYQKTVNAVQPGASKRSFNGAHFSIGDEASNVKAVTVYFHEQGDNRVAEPVCLMGFISSDAGGDGMAPAPTGGISDGGSGHILNELVANRLFYVLTNAAGSLQLNIEDSGAKTLYLVFVAPNGRLIVSPAITFV